VLCTFQDVDGLTFLSPSRISAGYVHAHKPPHLRLSVEYSLTQKQRHILRFIAPIFEPGTKQDCPRTFPSEWEQLIACRYSSVILASIQLVIVASTKDTIGPASRHASDLVHYLSSASRYNIQHSTDRRIGIRKLRTFIYQYQVLR